MSEYYVARAGECKKKLLYYGNDMRMLLFPICGTLYGIMRNSKHRNRFYISAAHHVSDLNDYHFRRTLCIIFKTYVLLHRRKTHVDL